MTMGKAHSTIIIVVFTGNEVVLVENDDILPMIHGYQFTIGTDAAPCD
jgi:hypothetical protein